MKVYLKKCTTSCYSTSVYVIYVGCFLFICVFSVCQFTLSFPKLLRSCKVTASDLPRISGLLGFWRSSCEWPNVSSMYIYYQLGFKKIAFCIFSTLKRALWNIETVFHRVKIYQISGKINHALTILAVWFRMYQYRIQHFLFKLCLN